MTTLKPCPFCGGKAKVRFSGSNNYYNDTVKGYIVVSCTTCRASVRGGFYQGESLENYPWPIDEMMGAEPAIANWNMRRRATRERTQQPDTESEDS